MTREGLIETLRDDLVAEKIAINTYIELIDSVSEEDARTGRTLSKVVTAKEEHVEQIVQVLETLNA